jgi:3-hydroxyisobutyrate dehydrogenase/2-hydroxy-3-oxopropionate reductase
MPKVAFIGLGVMGFPMARHLKEKGHEVTVYNRTGAKAGDWVAKHGGKSAPTPAEAAKGQDFVMLMVGNDNDVIEVATGKDGVLNTMSKGAILIDHTTASADCARKVATAAKAKGVDFIDAPVSGGQAGAENGKLTVMCGGEKAPFDRAKPVMDSYGRAVTLLGPAGSGQLTKMVNQICIAGLVQALSEGIAFAEHAKLDPLLVLDVISKGAAQSWQMENRGKTMSERKFDFGFAVDWMRKDLGICLDEAKRNGAKLPVTQIVAGYYDEVSKNGGKRWDTSSLITRL